MRLQVKRKAPNKNDLRTIIFSHILKTEGETGQGFGGCPWSRLLLAYRSAEHVFYPIISHGPWWLLQLLPIIPGRRKKDEMKKKECERLKMPINSLTILPLRSGECVFSSWVAASCTRRWKQWSSLVSNPSLKKSLWGHSAQEPWAAMWNTWPPCLPCWRCQV